MSLLTVIQTVCKRIGISSPTTVSGATDIQLQQLMALANEEGEEFSERYPWSVLHREATFTTLAAELQGTVDSIATDGFRYIISDTIWNRTQNRPLYGSLDARDWQPLKASNITGPFQEYRIRGGNLYFLPAPAAGETCAFEYITANWCQSSGGTPKSALTSDDDTFVIDEKLVTAGIIWRWKRTKGTVYQEDFRSYEIRVNDMMARDTGKPVLSLSGSATDRVPGIIVPSGNWPL